MSVNGINSATFSAPYEPVSQGAALGSATLLPEPETEGLDALGQMYLLMSKDSQLSAQSSKEQINAASEQKKQALDKYIAELKKAAEDREEGGFWSDIGSALSKVAGVASIVGAAALTVATCGGGGVVLALAITGVALSGAAMAQNEFHYLEELGVSAEVASYLSAGAAIGGGLMTGGAGLLNAGTGVASSIGNVTALAAGATSVAAGGATITGAVYERSAAGHDIEALKQQQKSEAMQREILMFIAALEETAERDQSNVKRIVNGIESQGMALEMASQGV